MSNSAPWSVSGGRARKKLTGLALRIQWRIHLLESLRHRGLAGDQHSFLMNTALDSHRLEEGIRIMTGWHRAGLFSYKGAGRIVHPVSRLRP